MHGDFIARDEAAFSLGGQTDAGHSTGDYVVVPDAHLLFHADFRRVGDDLKLVGDDGKTFLVADYFKAEHKLKLVSPDGAGLTADVVEALAGSAAPGQYAQAGAPSQGPELIGKVVSVQGFAQIVRNGVAITANTGDAVLKGDVVQTGNGSAISIIFTDSTTFNLSANARMVINEFVYDPNGASNGALINLVQGTIGFVAGQVAKTGDMRVKTPVATMGIRGTAVVVEISADNGTTKFGVVVEPSGHVGSYNLYDNVTGQLLGTVSNSSVGWVVRPVNPTEVFAQQLTKSAEDLQKELSIIQLVFQNQSAGQQLLNLTDPNNTKNTSIGTQFIVSDQLGINHDNSSVPKTITITYNGGGQNGTGSNDDGYVFGNHAPIARPDPGNQNFVNSVVESGVGPGNTPAPGTSVIHGDVLPNDYDPDGDPLEVSDIEALTATHGTLSILSDGTYTYTLNNADPVIDALALGETLEIVFKYTIKDPFGAKASATLTITVTGTNDQPVIDAAHTTPAASFTEIADGAPLENATTHSAQGTISFTDVDLSDTHHLGTTAPTPAFSWTGGTLTSAQQVALIAASHFTLDNFTDDAAATPGSVQWHYDITDAAIDFLAAGETLTITYPVVILDNNGASATQNVSITITGANDAPTIAAATDVAGAVTEKAEPDEGGLLTDSGSFSFSDVDLTDDHTIAVSAVVKDELGNPIASPLGDLTVSPTSTTNSGPAGTAVTWTYTVADSALDFLAAGETRTQVYTVTVDDGHGGTVTQTITVVITGTNDAPAIDAIAQTCLVEQTDTAPLTDTISVTFTDVDLTDTGHTATIVGVAAAGVVAGLTLTDAELIDLITPAGVTKDSGTAAGSVTLDFSAASTAFDYLAKDEVLTLTYTVQIDDGDGGIATKDFVVTITGTNDAPAIAAPAFSEADSDAFAADLGYGTVTPVDNGPYGPSYMLLGDDTANETGPFTRFDHYRSTWTGDFTTTAKVYLDTDWAAGSGFDYSVAINGTDGNHLRDFIFHVTKDTSTGELLVGASNNTSFAPDENLENGNHYTVTQSGWYTLEHQFRNVDGVLAVDLILLDADGNAVWSQTLSSPGDTIGEDGVVGGNRYGWFTFIDVPGGLPADGLSLDLSGASHVAEFADGSPLENTAPHTLTGTIGFSDVDLADTHTVSAVLVSAVDNLHGEVAALGTLVPVVGDDSTSDGSGTINWTFTVDDSALDSLAAGEIVTQKYDVTVSDGQGGTATQTITVIITGTNDAPVIAAQVPVFSVGFDSENDTIPSNGYGTIALVDEGNGLSYALFSNNQDDTGPFTNFGEYRAAWTGDFTTTAKVYLDADWDEGSGFDYSVAINRADGTHLRDYIFHITKDTSTGELLVGASNNSSFAPVENLEDGNHYTVTQSGWYTLEHQFRNVNGVLVVDLILLDASGTAVWSQSLSNPGDTIGEGGIVGGNRYGWFTFIDLHDSNGDSIGLPVDGLSLDLSGISSDGAAHTVTVSGLSVSDVDAGSDPVTLSIDIGGDGSLAMHEIQPNGVTANDADGSDGTLSFTGSLADINAFLSEGFTYTAGENDGATAEKLTVRIDDGHGGIDTVNFVFAEPTSNNQSGIALTGTTGEKDIFVGTAGADTFIFTPAFGHDTIANFQQGIDKIDLGYEGDFQSVPVAQGQIDLAAWVASGAFEQVGNDTLIHITANDDILLKNVAATALTANDFVVHPPLVG